MQSHQPDLAVVDIMQPGVNGLEGTRRLKALAPDLRVILASAYCNHAAAYRAAAQAGAEIYIAKDELDVNVVHATSTVRHERAFLTSARTKPLL